VHARLFDPFRTVILYVENALAEVGQSMHAPEHLSGKGSNHNGKEVGIVEEPLENVEVFGGNLSAIDFIEEHEEDEGDEDILFMLFSPNLYCCILVVVPKSKRTPSLLIATRAFIKCILPHMVFISAV